MKTYEPRAVRRGLYEIRLTAEGSLEIRSYSARMKGKLLRHTLSGNGYYTVSLESRNQYVHILLAELVYGPCPEGMEVNHKDGNKLNNDPENLEYVTHRQNIKHAHALGLHPGVATHGLSHTKEWKKEYDRLYRERNRERLAAYDRSRNQRGRRDKK